MADAFGKLTDSEKNEIIETLAKKGFNDYKCVVCGAENFSISPYLTSSLVLNQAHEIDGSLYVSERNPLRVKKAALSAQIICENCGLAHNFLLQPLGILPNLEKMTSETESSDGN